MIAKSLSARAPHTAALLGLAALLACGEPNDDASTFEAPSAQLLDAGIVATRDAAAPAVVGDCAGDPLATLRRYAPGDAKLAREFEKYLTQELGPLTCATSGTGQARTITQTIYVPPGAVYDGRGETLTADVAAMRCDTRAGEGDEGQRPFFVLAPGASLRNVRFAYPGCEGVHMMGDNELDHVVWTDVGEDAASVRTYFPGGKIVIRDSEGHKAGDKMFQFNAPCDVRIERFVG
ncbi:MAG: pectate lyase, partial [Polyangiales bacterium]